MSDNVRFCIIELMIIVRKQNFTNRPHAKVRNERNLFRDYLFFIKLGIGKNPGKGDLINPRKFFLSCSRSCIPQSSATYRFIQQGDFLYHRFYIHAYCMHMIVFFYTCTKLSLPAANEVFEAFDYYD